MNSGKSAWLSRTFAATTWQSLRGSQSSKSAVIFHDTSLSSLPCLLVFCCFLDAHVFLGDISKFSSDALPSEVAHSLMTLFNSIIGIVPPPPRFLLSIFSWWWR